MTAAYKECVSGFGHTSSLWFHFAENQMVGYTIETPKGIDTLGPDAWFKQHMLIIKTSKKHLQKSIDVLPYLTFIAGERAVNAIRDYNVYELAISFTSHYGWQIINGAKILPAYGELAKVYAGTYAVYLFRAQPERDAAMNTVQSGPAT
jgi:hypothetical protein